jgi:hypothetical protein
MWTHIALCLLFSVSIQPLASLFQYTDEVGNQHIVDDAELIPPRFRRNVSVLDDEGQVLGDLESNTGVSADNSRQLEGLKERGRGREKSNKKSSRQLLGELLQEEPDEFDELETGKAAPKSPKSRDSKGSTAPQLPEGSPTWMLLAVALIFVVFALKLLQGFLRMAAFACAVMALLLFVAEEYGDTPVGSKVKVATENIVAPLKKIKNMAGDKMAVPLSAPYEIIDKVRGAVRSQQGAADERNAILDKLSTGE